MSAFLRRGVISCYWADLPAAASYTGRTRKLKDTWAKGALVVSDGSHWIADRPIDYIVGTYSDSVTGATSLTLLREWAIPAGLLGKNGRLEIYLDYILNNTANIKNPSLYLYQSAGGLAGGSRRWNLTGGSAVRASGLITIQNNNSASAQTGGCSISDTGTLGKTTAQTIDAAVNTDNAFYVGAACTPINAGDTVTLHMARISIHPRG